MPEKKHVYEANTITTLKLKTATENTPSSLPDTKRYRRAQTPRKSTPEMIAIVLRLIEYFENS